MADVVDSEVWEITGDLTGEMLCFGAQPEKLDSEKIASGRIGVTVTGRERCFPEPVPLKRVFVGWVCRHYSNLVYITNLASDPSQSAK